MGVSSDGDAARQMAPDETSTRPASTRPSLPASTPMTTANSSTVDAPRSGVNAPRSGVNAPRSGVNAPRSGVNAPSSSRHATTGATQSSARQQLQEVDAIVTETSRINGFQLPLHHLQVSITMLLSINN